MDSSGNPIVKAEPEDHNMYTSLAIPDDDQNQQVIKEEPAEDEDSLFIPEAPAPLPSNYTPITALDLAYRPAPSSRPALTHQEVRPTQISMPPPAWTPQSTLPALPTDFQHTLKHSHSRIPDNDGNDAPTLCFASSLRHNGFQHRLICGHLVVTDVRLPCGLKCKLEGRSDTKPANKSTIECPHPNCASIRKSMAIVLRPRKKSNVAASKKPGVKIVPEGQTGHHVNLGALGLQEVKDTTEEGRPVKRIRVVSTARYAPAPIPTAADEYAERRLKEQLGMTSRQQRELRKLQVDGTDTLKFKQPAGWQFDQDSEMEKLRQRRQFTATLNSGMYSMPEDHHDQLIKGVPGLVVDRELEDSLGNALARAKGTDILHTEDDETDLNDLVSASFTSVVKDLHCVCKQPKDHAMLQCGTCLKHFHAHCIGKGLSHPARFDLDPQMSHNADAEHWRAQDEQFPCRKCDTNTMFAQHMLGAQKRKKTEDNIDSGHERPDLRDGKLAKLKECKTDDEKVRVQKAYGLLYSHESKLSWESDFFCAKCDEQITGTRYHCTSCVLFDLCESCMRKGKEHPCLANSSSYRVFYASIKDIEMGGTANSTVANDQTIHGRPMRRAAQRAMGGMSNLTHPKTIAEVRRQSIFK